MSDPCVRQAMLVLLVGLMGLGPFFVPLREARVRQAMLALLVGLVGLGPNFSRTDGLPRRASSGV